MADDDFTEELRMQVDKHGIYASGLKGVPGKDKEFEEREVARPVLDHLHSEYALVSEPGGKGSRAIEALRAALAARKPGAPRKQREGTKQEQVLAMLRRAEGATIAQICEATGWQQHTVRGFFAGLKKRQGIEVQVQERVRQVGPNKEGARDSYTVYHLPA